MSHIKTVITGHYNEFIILLSIIIAIISSFISIDIVSRVAKSKGNLKCFWIIISSIIMGIGVWSMHFIGMLSFSLPIPVSFHLGYTLLSVVCILVSAFITFYLVSRESQKKWQILLGGFVIGIGIVSMHYLGMYAMEMDAIIRYDKSLFLLSCIIAFVTSYVALFIFNRFKDNTKTFSSWKIISSIVMGIAISGMHYTGMKASQFCLPTGPTSVNITGLNGQSLGIIVLVATMFIFFIGFCAALFDRKVLEKMAYIDSLTGFYNRHSFLEFLQTSSKQEDYVLMYIDLDGFKLINDTLGHDVGDLVISNCAKRILNITEQLGKTYRVGGDEFVFIAKQNSLITNRSKIKEIASQILYETAKPFLIEEHEFVISASIGIACSNNKQGLIPLSVTYKNSDIAMYFAKKNGKNQYTFYSEEMSILLNRKVLISDYLRNALNKNEFVILYQPQYDIKRNKIIGVEALLRWNQEELGMISPVEFIPIAEETGLITDITEWIIKTVVTDYKAWKQESSESFTVSINLSVRTILADAINPLLDKLIQVENLKLDFIELEVTESIAMHNMNFILKQLAQIRKKGVKISMDDFGTGYSSLSYLKKFPIQKLKIDRSFLQGIPEDSSDQAIVSSIISIATHLGLEVIAEGVETDAQVQFLLENGCEIIQGYWFSKPITFDKISTLLLKQEQGTIL